jgi:hypothetical protein
MVLTYAKLYVVIFITFIAGCGANSEVVRSECVQNLGRKLRTLYQLTNLVGGGPKHRELNLDVPPTPEELHFLDINNILRQVLFGKDQPLQCCDPWYLVANFALLATEVDASKKKPYPTHFLSHSAMRLQSLLKFNLRHSPPQFKRTHLYLLFLMSPTSKSLANRLKSLSNCLPVPLLR